MALKRMAVPRIDANAVSFPRMMLLSRVQPKFKDCAQPGGAGPSLSQRRVSPRGWATNYPSLPALGSPCRTLHNEGDLQDILRDH